MCYYYFLLVIIYLIFNIWNLEDFVWFLYLIYSSVKVILVEEKRQSCLTHR